MNKHKAKQDIGEKELYQCDICDKLLRDKYYLSQHKLRHAKAFTVFCSVCNKGFMTVQEMEKHVNGKHSKKQRFECDECGLMLSCKQTLTQHIQSIHLNFKPHVCEVCQAAFTKASNLKVHEQGVHSSNRKFPCDSCPKTFSTHSRLMGHVDRIHTEGMPFACEPFLLEHIRKRHMEKEQPKLKACEHCDKMFANGQNLRRHVNRIHAAKSHQCPICGFASGDSRSVQKHMQLVHGENVECDLCDFSCQQPAYLQHHINGVHKKDDQYLCKKCGTIFSSPTNASAHRLKCEM